MEPFEDLKNETPSSGNYTHPGFMEYIYSLQIISGGSWIPQKDLNLSTKKYIKI